MNSSKVIPYEEAEDFFAKLKQEGHVLVQCHGTFDLVHPGHVQHLEQARMLGDLLVVTITAEKFVNKGPGRPYFNDELRVKNLASLIWVDYVVVIPFPAAVEAISCVKPQFYCKGKEYENPEVDVTGNIHDDVVTVKKFGGEIRYVGDPLSSSTRLINHHFTVVNPKVKAFCAKLALRYKFDQLRQWVDSFSDLKVLVLGDIIFDRYSYLKVQGLTSKNRIISGRFLKEETHGGGALAVYRHIKQFAGSVKLMSLVGKEPWVTPLLRENLPEEDDLNYQDENFTTIIKRRFVEPLSEGKELSKLFSVNYIDAQHPGDSTQQAIIKKLETMIQDFDVVYVADFGHGLMTAPVRKFVQEKAPYLVLNCQTNSNNHGFNIINQKYYRADAFSLDEQELLLASGSRDVDYKLELEKMAGVLGAKYAWLTRGAVETLGLKSGEEGCLCPPLENDVTDTVGAGDAFFSVAGLAAKRNLPSDLSTFLGQLAGAQAVKIVGNQQSISKVNLLKSASSLINY